jgi:hypothetical protein
MYELLPKKMFGYYGSIFHAKSASKSYRFLLATALTSKRNLSPENHGHAQVFLDLRFLGYAGRFNDLQAL